MADIIPFPVEVSPMALRELERHAQEMNWTLEGTVYNALQVWAMRMQYEREGPPHVLAKPETKVIHLKDAPHGWRGHPDYVYIGRGVRGQVTSFGNRYIIGPDGTRDEVIAQYRKWAETKIEEDADFRQNVAALHGKTLVCYCAPKKCHGDVLKELADKLANQPACSSR